MELKKIIQEFKKIRDEEKLSITDTTLFTEALDLYISMGIQEGYSKNNKKSKKQEFEPITDKQKRKLYVLKYKENAENLSKEEARKLIYNLVNQQI